MSRTCCMESEADASREETGKCTGREWRGTGPSTYTRTMETTSGTTIFQQGLAATCKDQPEEHIAEPEGGIWWGAWVAAVKAIVQWVKVPPCQLPESGT